MPHAISAPLPSVTVAALAKHIALPGTSPMWQRGFFDHLLRSDESYGDKWNYVRKNRARAGLVTKADHWRIQERLCSSIAHNCSRPPVGDVSTASRCEAQASNE